MEKCEAGWGRREVFPEDMRLGLESEEKPPRGSWERASQTAGGREAGRPAGLRGRVGQVPGAAAKVEATMQAGRPNSGQGSRSGSSAK